MELVNISDINPSIRLDIRYATKNNFTKTKLYSKPLCMLRPAIAKALDSVQKELQKEKLGLVVWDAYRPPSVQKKLREYVDDPNFVSLVSNHSRGIAVDVTLCRTDGTLIAMPTEFDDFSEKARSDCLGLTKDQLVNRNKLKTVMHKYGFSQNAFEWWHFDHSMDAEVIEYDF